MTLEELAKKIEVKQAEMAALVSEYNAEHDEQDDVVLAAYTTVPGRVGEDGVRIQVSEPLPGMVADGPVTDDGYIHYGMKAGITEFRACKVKK